MCRRRPCATHASVASDLHIQRTEHCDATALPCRSSAIRAWALSPRSDARRLTGAVSNRRSHTDPAPTLARASALWTGTENRRITRQPETSTASEASISSISQSWENALMRRNDDLKSIVASRSALKPIGSKPNAASRPTSAARQMLRTRSALSMRFSTDGMTPGGATGNQSQAGTSRLTNRQRIDKTHRCFAEPATA